MFKRENITACVAAKTSKSEATAWANIVIGPFGSTATHGIKPAKLTVNAAAALSVLKVLERINQSAIIELRFGSYYLYQVGKMIHYWKQGPNAWTKERFEDRGKENPVMESVANADILKAICDQIDQKQHIVRWLYTEGCEEGDWTETHPDVYLEAKGDKHVKLAEDDQVIKMAKETLASFLAGGYMPPKPPPIVIPLPKESTLVVPSWLEFSPR